MIDNFYSEGNEPTHTLFYMPQPALTFNSVVVRKYSMGVFGIVFDQEGPSTYLTVSECEGLNNYAISIHKGRTIGAATFVNNLFDYDDLPGAFDLDATSAAHSYYLNKGRARYGSKLIADSVTVASYAEGSEPASPIAGQQIFDSSVSRPSFYIGSAWKQAAFVDDATDLSKLLSSYCVDAWDPAIYKYRTVVSGGLDTLTGVLHGSAGAAVDAAHRPVWNASDEIFRGRPSFSCTVAGGQYMIVSSIATQPIGTPLGAFIVGRLTGSLPQTGNRNFLWSSALSVFADDTDNAGANGWQATENNSSPARRNGATLTHDLNGHVMTVGNRAASGEFDFLIDGLRNGFADNNDSLASSFSGPLQFGAFNGTASDVTIAYIALLNQPLPLAIETKAIAMANQIYGLGF